MKNGRLATGSDEINHMLKDKLSCHT